jgi:hypothetical protein
MTVRDVSRLCALGLIACLLCIALLVPLLWVI